MLNPLFAASAMMMLLAAPAAGPASPAPPPPPADWEGAAGAWAQHVVIHVPQMSFTSRTTIITRSVPISPPQPPRVPMFVERKAKDCVKMDRIMGYVWTQSDSVDLVLNDGSRLRAKLGANCPAIAFYGGFYVKPNSDGKMCAGRDSIHLRSGATCGLQGFRSLVLAR
ncbi:MAG: hypothetical protein WDN44_12405 [Sphingomonas sp.]